MKFTTKLFLPILKKEVRYNSFNNSHYFEILKFITNNDDIGLNDYFEWLLQFTIKEKDIYLKLSNIEKFIILLDLRSIGMGDTLELVGNNNVKMEFLLSSIKNNIISKISNLNLNEIHVFDDIKIGLSLPKKLLIENIDDVYKEIINFLQIQEENINFSLLTDSEKEDIIKNLPATISNNILNYINLNKDINKINIITGNSKYGIDNVPLNFLDKTMFYFLKSILAQDLLNFYELQYNLIYKLNINYKHFMSMTPNECKIFINFYNRDKKKEEEAQNKSNTMPSLPSMPSFPKFK